MSTTKRILLFGAAALVAAFWLGPDTAVTAEQLGGLGQAQGQAAGQGRGRGGGRGAEFARLTASARWAPR